MPTFTNVATLTYRGLVASSNPVTGELRSVLAVSVAAAGDSYLPGGDVTYAIGLVNTGGTPLSGLTVTDDLGAPAAGGAPAPLSYVPDSARLFADGLPQPVPAVTAGPPLVFSGLAVPAGGNAVLVYRARVNQYAPPAAGGSITSTVSVTGAGLSSVPTATETVEAAERPILSVVKSLSPTSVTANSRVTYTFVIQNAGNTAAEATEAAVLSDVFDPILADLSVTFDGAPWSAPAHYASRALRLRRGHRRVFDRAGPAHRARRHRRAGRRRQLDHPPRPQHARRERHRLTARLPFPAAWLTPQTAWPAPPPAPAGRQTGRAAPQMGAARPVTVSLRIGRLPRLTPRSLSG